MDAYGASIDFHCDFSSFKCCAFLFYYQVVGTTPVIGPNPVVFLRFRSQPSLPAQNLIGLHRWLRLRQSCQAQQEATTPKKKNSRWKKKKKRKKGGKPCWWKIHIAPFEEPPPPPEPQERSCHLWTGSVGFYVAH